VFPGADKEVGQALKKREPSAIVTAASRGARPSPIAVAQKMGTAVVLGGGHRGREDRPAQWGEGREKKGTGLGYSSEKWKNKLGRRWICR
jgi:hypothetical protein